MKFRYSDDTFQFHFSKLFKKNENVFFSVKYGYGFRHFSDYWAEIGKRRSLVSFISTRNSKVEPKGYMYSEVMQRLARSELGDGPGVVIYDINPTEVSKFASRMPGINPAVFMEDVIVFPMKSREAALKLAEAVPAFLGSSMAVSEGFVIYTNG